MPPCRHPFTDLPGTSRLFGDYLYQFNRVRRFYGSDPAAEASFRTAASSLEYPAPRRRALVEALRAQNGGSPTLDALAAPETFVVATGQQVGLFLGPCYTIYKALTAARLARRLTELGLRCVPVFWLAAEDHDYREVNHCWVFGGGGAPVRIAIQPETAVQQPAGEVVLQSDPSADLQGAISELPHAGEVLALAREAYAPGRTLGGAFRRFLQRLLAPFGLLCLDPLDPAIRELAAPLLARAARQAPRLIGKALERSRELEAAGYHAQVRVEAGRPLMFLLDQGRRLPLRNDASLQGVSAAALSPGALLRPVAQDYILPTVASVMGPAEIAYMAQAGALYEALEQRPPVLAPRASFTLLDSEAAALMDRFGLRLTDLFGPEDALGERIGRDVTPPALRRSLDRTRREIEALTAAQCAGLAGYDPTLAEAMDRSRRKILYQLGKIERKVAREALRRDPSVSAGLARLTRLVYPMGRLQERFYSILPFLALHGFGIIGRAYESIDLVAPDHRLLTL